ncbi:MAG: imidazole glycerol phosphate synthase subunit HisH, partial [Conexivisphaerales archaeon]
MIIGIIDYGASNLFSLKAAFERIGGSVKMVESNIPYELDLLVMPGVGSFGQAASSIEHIRESVIDFINNGGTFVGICLGLHLMFESSEEGPGRGLGLLAGQVKRIRSGKVPHMGWSETRLIENSDLWDGLKNVEYFYYAHSYFPEYFGDGIKALVDYGEKMPAMVQKGNLIGVQFHPEKSGIPRSEE